MTLRACLCVCVEEIRREAVIWEMGECYSRCSTLHPPSLHLPTSLSVGFSAFNCKKKKKKNWKGSKVFMWVWRVCVECKGCVECEVYISNGAALCDKWRRDSDIIYVCPTPNTSCVLVCLMHIYLSVCVCTMSYTTDAHVRELFACCLWACSLSAWSKL